MMPVLEQIRPAERFRLESLEQFENPLATKTFKAVWRTSSRKRVALRRKGGYHSDARIRLIGTLEGFKYVSNI